MQTKIHESTQIVEVMLTHAEQADEAVKKQLKELYAQYKGTKYTVVVFLSGKRDLYEDTRDLLLFNRRRAAERAVQARQGGRSVSAVRQRRFRFLLCQIFCRLQW